MEPRRVRQPGESLAVVSARVHRGGFHGDLQECEGWLVYGYLRSGHYPRGAIPVDGWRCYLASSALAPAVAA